jgi:hypothetical protein
MDVTDRRAAEVSRETVRKFERGGSLRTTNVEAIQRALETAGVIWIDAKDGGPGARLREARRRPVALAVCGSC